MSPDRPVDWEELLRQAWPAEWQIPEDFALDIDELEGASYATVYAKPYPQIRAYFTLTSEGWTLLSTHLLALSFGANDYAVRLIYLLGWEWGLEPLATLIARHLIPLEQIRAPRYP